MAPACADSSLVPPLNQHRKQDRQGRPNGRSRGRAGSNQRSSDRGDAPRNQRRAEVNQRSAERRAAELGEVSAFQSVRIRVVEDRPGPNELIVHAGPTNSGKTHDSLLALAEAGSGVYAGPLRMLAREAFERLSSMCGERRVGLITGEERINADAPIICATAEAAPLTGSVAVIDECHWLSDKDRGWAWTRLLIAGGYGSIHAITDPSAVQLITRLVPDALDVQVIHHERLGGLDFAGVVPVHKLPEGAAVVAFSRRGVHAIADHLKSMGRRPAVLYGALPPHTRRDQVAKLISGEADIIVCTDVIGHGINLPLTAVALAETWKYDGTERRRLHLWEAAQILGRAGRFGHTDEVGRTFAVTGQRWFSDDDKFIAQATRAAAGLESTRMERPCAAPLRPVFGELSVSGVKDLIDAIDAWALTAERASAVLPLTGFDSKAIRNRVKAWRSMAAIRNVDPRDVWQAATCPIDDDTLALVGLLALHGSPQGIARLEHYRNRAADTGKTVGSAEAAASTARDLRTLTHSLGDLPGLSVDEAERLEDKASVTVTKRLAAGIGKSGFGKCGVCGDACMPWFGLCDACYARGCRAAV